MPKKSAGRKGGKPGRRQVRQNPGSENVPAPPVSERPSERRGVSPPPAPRVPAAAAPTRPSVTRRGPGPGAAPLDYSYVRRDLRRIVWLSGGIVALLALLTIWLR